VSAISDDGTILVGEAFNTAGQFEPSAAVLSEPVQVVWLIWAIAAAFCRRRRRRAARADRDFTE
jgi:hypothetical protein